MSLILTDAGRSWIASLVKDAPMFLAIGAGIAAWDTDKEHVASFSPGVDTINVGYTKISSVVVEDASNDEIVYVLGTDYTVNLTTGIVTRIGIGSIGNTDVRISFHVDPPNPSRTDTSLQGTVLGWKKVVSIRYVSPDPEGDIVTIAGNFAISEDPTPYLLIAVSILTSELSSAQVKTVGLFTNTTPIEGLPGGQEYFTPEQIETTGFLFATQIMQTINRTPTSREDFQFVIPL